MVYLYMSKKKENVQAYVSSETKQAILEMATKEKRSVSQMAGVILETAINKKWLELKA